MIPAGGARGAEGAGAVGERPRCCLLLRSRFSSFLRGGSKSLGSRSRSAADARHQRAGSRLSRGDPHISGALFDAPSMRQPHGAPPPLPPPAASSQRRRPSPSNSMLPRPLRLARRHRLPGPLTLPPPRSRGLRWEPCFQRPVKEILCHGRLCCTGRIKGLLRGPMPG